MKKIPTQSAGSIIYYQEKDEYYFLLVHARQGHWGFAKGHVKYGETLLEAAIREVREETSMNIVQSVESNYIITDNYTYSSFKEKDALVLKSSAYFPTQLEVEPKVSIQRIELKDFGWFSSGEVLQKLTHDHTRKMFQQFLDEYINK